MSVHRGVVVAFAILSLMSLFACGKKDDDEGNAKPTATPPSEAPPPTPPAAPTPPSDLKADTPAAKVGIEARVKAELDGRTDGITGSPLAVAGALASMQAPTGWQTTKSGDITVAASGDKKAQLAASSPGAEGATAKLPAATAALGLASCEWNAPEAVAVGKTKLAAMAADGVCTRGTTQVRAAYVAPTAEKLLVVGGWDPDGDSASVFGAMRSIAKATGGGDPTGIGACCSALRQNAKSAPPEQQSALLLAAGVCEALKNDPQGRAALAQVRAALAGANVPATCR